eukprot:COSAG01_NODE_54528_length_331_cov_1.116379_1_plen_37_part_01
MASAAVRAARAAAVNLFPSLARCSGAVVVAVAEAAAA